MGNLQSKRLRTLGSEWTMLAFALPLAVLLFQARGSSLAVGEDIEVRFTLITADRTATMCASPESIFGRFCGYRSVPSAVAQPPRSGALQPFSTIGGRLYLVENLFAEPALVARVALEPPAGKDPKHLRRFEARCGLRLLGKVSSVHIRFTPAGPWGMAPTLWVGVPHDCKVIG